MNCCHGGCGCEKKVIFPDIDKIIREVAREKAKVCPQCNSTYLAMVPVPMQPLRDIPTHCTECGAEEVWAYLPFCWCGAAMRPRDTYCHYHGHAICRCKDKAACPGWHDYSSRFIDS